MVRILLSAAEPSGDVLGAELASILRQRAGVALCGVAGPRMRASGVESVAQTEEISVMGVAEVLRQLPRIRSARAKVEGAIDRGEIDVFVGIDAPDFHLALARRARARGIATVGYVSPQIWAWRPGRASTIADAYDTLLCLFDFEPALYADTRTRAVWVGHPVVDRFPSRDEVEPQLFGLAPASRRQEMERHWPVFVAAAERVAQQRPGVRFVLVTRPDLVPGSLPDFIEVAEDITSLRSARGVLCKSGTVTLELAVMGVPMVVAHRVHPATWGVGRALVRGVRHIALPNILAGREVVPEVVQHLDAEDLATRLLALPGSQELVLAALGEGGAAERAAAHIVEVAGG